MDVARIFFRIAPFRSPRTIKANSKPCVDNFNTYVHHPMTMVAEIVDASQHSLFHVRTPLQLPVKTPVYVKDQGLLGALVEGEDTAVRWPRTVLLLIFPEHSHRGVINGIIDMADCESLLGVDSLDLQLMRTQTPSIKQPPVN